MEGSRTILGITALVILSVKEGAFFYNKELDSDLSGYF